MAMGDQPGDPHYEAELAKALNEAKSKGLPDSWTVKLDLVSHETVNEQQTAMAEGCRTPLASWAVPQSSLAGMIRSIASNHSHNLALPLLTEAKEAKVDRAQRQIL
jgi:hypothetical protein